MRAAVRRGRPCFSRLSNHAWSGFSPAIESGRRMFSSAVSIGSRLKNWKTKPMCSRRSLRQLVVARASPSSVPAIETVPEVGRSSAGEDVHQRRLAGAGRAHDGGQLPALDVERDAAKGVDGGLALAVAAGEVTCRLQQRSVRAEPHPRQGLRRLPCLPSAPSTGSVCHHLHTVNGGSASVTREHDCPRSGGGAQALLGARPAARLLRRPRRHAGAGRGDRRDRGLPARVERERRRAVRDEPPHRGARRAGPRRPARFLGCTPEE